MPDLSPDVLKAALIKAMDGGMVPESSTAASAPSPRSHTPMHLALGAMGGGQLADALTTIQALHQPGLEEGNSGLYGAHPSAGRVLGTKAATMIPTGILLDKLYTTHPKLAMGLALALGGGGVALAAHNVSAMRGAQ